MTINENDRRKVEFIDKTGNKGYGDRIRVIREGKYWYKLYGKSFKNRNAGKHQIVGVLQETTESHLAKDRLAQAATVFECASEGIIILNKDRQFSCANNAFYEITKFQPRNLRNKELPFLTNRSLGEDSYHNIWQGIDKSGHWQGEIKAFKRNKETMYAWLTIGFIPADVSDEKSSW